MKKVLAVLVLTVGLFSTSAMALSGVKHDCYKNSFGGYTSGFAYTKITVGTMPHRTRAWVGFGKKKEKYGTRYTQTDVVTGWGRFHHDYYFV